MAAQMAAIARGFPTVLRSTGLGKLRFSAAAAAASALSPSKVPTVDLGRVKAAHADPDAVQADIDRRKGVGDAHAVARLYGDMLRLQQEVEGINRERKVVAKSREEASVEEGKRLKMRLAEVQEELNQAQYRAMVAGDLLPNATHPDAPVGGDEAAEVVKFVGERRDFDFEPRDHLEIGEKLDLFDFAGAAQTAGAKFAFLKNEAVFLELALVQFALARAVAAGFAPMMTPDVARSHVVQACGFHPRGESSQVYFLENTDLCLVGTSEIAVAGIHADQIINEEDLPLKNVAFSHCFRKEAGSGGQASKGLYRLHQFSKVELFAVSDEDSSDQVLQDIVEFQTRMFDDLGLHCRVLNMPTEELGASAYQKFDIEAWMPGREDYGEVSSASNCTSYQAHRLGIRYRAAGSKRPIPAHTLNGTACAVPRTMLALLETHQREDGTVAIPAALQPFMGGRTAITGTWKQ